ncbi:conserved hypothetical protein [Trichinella spiralis]|uniref:hypothetical protein n=1 Tax=Trichinella spiralis TaxID=6334 RepID=UPI0001EFD1DF|nr:conserved hypothetical protein [Trichinella spiralis]
MEREFSLPFTDPPVEATVALRLVSRPLRGKRSSRFAPARKSPVAGPLYVKDEQRPLQKVYICLFTCMVT